MQLWGTSGRGTSGRGTSGRGTSVRGGSAARGASSANRSVTSSSVGRSSVGRSSRRSAGPASNTLQRWLDEVTDDDDFVGDWVVVADSEPQRLVLEVDGGPPDLGRLEAELRELLDARRPAWWAGKLSLRWRGAALLDGGVAVERTCGGADGAGADGGAADGAEDDADWTGQVTAEVR